MKTILRFYLLAGLLVVAAGLSAQPPGRGGDPSEIAAQQTERMTKALELTDAQATQVETILLKYLEKGQTAREEAAGDREAMQASMQTIRTEQAEELKAVLTEEQFAKLQKMQAERQGRRGHGRRGNG